MTSADDELTAQPPQTHQKVRYRTITRLDGITESERYLQGLCERSFLRLWSYPGVYRDQGLSQRKEGKEVSDLLVVFGNSIIIFSDKRCAFPNTGNIQQDWSRWFRKAVFKSAEQIWGAERWILSFPDRLRLDRRCTVPFPLVLPSREQARIHRVVVAHGVSDRCRAHHGGTGTLMITPHITGEAHFNYPRQAVIPFAVGDLDPTRGFVHVLDDQALDTLLTTIDTLPDFLRYLDRKEALIRSGRLGAASGEDDLLAVYLTNMDEDGHSFPVPGDATRIVVSEGVWSDFESHPLRIAQIQADRVSYMWDALIEEFTTHMLAGTSSFRSHEDVAQVEPALRYMAAEPRVRRRMLAQSLADVLESKPHGSNRHFVRVNGSPNSSDPWYVFLTLEHVPSESDSEYRKHRRFLLESYCLVARYLNPSVPAVVGLAMEPRLARKERSEDILAFDARDWSPETEERARYLHDEVGLLREQRKFAASVREYPIVAPASNSHRQPLRRAPGPNPRNRPCPCGSGLKFKKCCGR